MLARWVLRPSGLMLALLLIVTLAPLFVTAMPPLHDYPVHLARMDAIAALAGTAVHATQYQLGSFLLPNVAMDVAALGLTMFLPPVLAGRVFLGIVLLMLLSGTVALHRVLHGRFSPWPLLATFFLYNWIFLYGFINYLFGVAAMLWGIAAWVAMARAGVVPRLLVGTALAVIILFCHMVAFGLFAVVVGSLALSETTASWRTTRRIELGSLVIAAIPLGVALALFVMLSPTAGEAREPFVYAQWIGWKPLVAYRTVLSSIPWLDAITLGPLAILIGLAAWRRRLVLARPMLLPIGMLCLTFLIMPAELFGALYVDMRLPIVVLLVVIASLDLRGLSRSALIAGGTVAMGLLIVRCAVIAIDWRASAPVFAEYEAAFDRLPAGSTLYVATAEPYPRLAYDSPTELSRWHPPLKHVASLASIGRDVFVAATIANPYQQPIVVLPSLLAAKELQGDNPFKTPTADALAGVVTQIRTLHMAGAASQNFLLLLWPHALQGAPPAGLDSVASGGSFALFRVE